MFDFATFQITSPSKAPASPVRARQHGMYEQNGWRQCLEAQYYSLKDIKLELSIEKLEVVN